jgi:25S rRNA (uracil2843-N3)-methyltransferase
MAPAKNQRGKAVRSRPPEAERRDIKQGSKATVTQNGLSLEFQQELLDIFRRIFPFDDDNVLRSTVQEVKGHLFQRDFIRAFAKPEYLNAYALRWSAGRALGYCSILLHEDLQEVWASEQANAQVETSRSIVSGEDFSHASTCKVVSIGGGGGAEVVACAAIARILSFTNSMHVHVVDIADWSDCLREVENTLHTPPQLSPFASESVKAANKAFIGKDNFKTAFSQENVLAINEAELKALLDGVRLCTIMFTLNELFTTSPAKATMLLLALTEVMPLNSWLLVVDSPGSYSEVKLGSSTKQYPMKWLLDHTLLEVAGGEESSKRKWRKVVSDDSRWFRLTQRDLKYPTELENMRYQIHLYQRIEDGDGRNREEENNRHSRSAAVEGASQA